VGDRSRARSGSSERSIDSTIVGHARARARVDPGALGVGARARPREGREDRGADQHDEQRGGDREADAVAAHRLAQQVPEPPALRVDRLAAQPALEVGGELAGGGVALVAFLGERAAEDRGEVGVDALRHARLDLGDRAHDVGQRAVGGMRQRARHQLEEHDAERVDVAAHVDRVGGAAQLLGRRVSERADEPARPRDRRGGGAGVDALGQPEVEDARLARRIDADVPGLQVAVDDAVLVGVVHRAADLDEEGDGVAGGPARDAPRLRELVERDPLDELHGEEEAPVARAALVEQRDDVHVAELEDGLDLAVETGDLRFVRERAVEEDLERDLAPRRELHPLVDDPLAAPMELGGHAVAVDLGQRGRRGGRCRGRITFGRDQLAEARDHLIVGRDLVGAPSAVGARIDVEAQLRRRGTAGGELFELGELRAGRHGPRLTSRDRGA